MKYLKSIALVILFVSSSFTVFGQINADKDTADCVTAEIGNTKLSYDVSADLVSRYVWRGTQYGGNGPSIQPNLCLTWGGLNVGFWGAYSINGTNSSQELDIYASYTFWNDMFTFGVTDYFFTNDSLHEDPLNFKQNSTGHILEPSLAFNGTDKIPFHLLLAANVLGNDAHIINDDPTSTLFNQNDGIQYSTYLEIGYLAEYKETTFDFFLGLNLTKPRGEDTTIFVAGDPTNYYLGESGFYGNDIGIVNVGFSMSKAIHVNEKYDLPISASIIYNPMSKDYFFVFGISF
jgi:hypothetical protein